MADDIGTTEGAQNAYRQFVPATKETKDFISLVTKKPSLPKPKPKPRNIAQTLFDPNKSVRKSIEAAKKQQNASHEAMRLRKLQLQKEAEYQATLQAAEVARMNEPERGYSREPFGEGEVAAVTDFGRELIPQTRSAQAERGTIPDDPMTAFARSGQQAQRAIGDVLLGVLSAGTGGKGPRGQDKQRIAEAIGTMFGVPESPQGLALNLGAIAGGPLIEKGIRGVGALAKAAGRAPSAIRSTEGGFAQIARNVMRGGAEAVTPDQPNEMADLIAGLMGRKPRGGQAQFKPKELGGYEPGVTPDLRAGLGAVKESLTVDTPTKPPKKGISKGNARDAGVSEPKAAPKPKEPWEMTREEYFRYMGEEDPTVRPAKGRATKRRGYMSVQWLERQHEDSIMGALSEGKPVPAEVLADYPDLAAKYAKPPKTKLGEAAQSARADLETAKTALAKSRQPRKMRGGKQAGAAYVPLNKAEIDYFLAWSKSKGLDAAEAVEQFVKHMSEEFGDNVSHMRAAVRGYLDEVATAKAPEPAPVIPKGPPVAKVVPEPPKVSAVRHEDTKRVRELIGTDPYEKEVIPDEKLLARAKGKNAHEVALRVGNDQMVDADEMLAMGVEVRRLEGLMDVARQKGDKDAWSKHFENATILADALDIVGSKAGRTMRARRLLLDNAYNSFGLTRMAEKAAGPGGLKPKFSKELEATIKNLEGTNAALSEELTAARKQIEALLTKRTTLGPRSTEKVRMDALSKLRRLGFDTAEPGSPLSGGAKSKQAGFLAIPEGKEKQTADAIRQLIRSYADAESTFDGVMKQLQADLPGIGEEDVHWLLGGGWRKAKLEADLARRKADQLVRNVKADAVYHALPLYRKVAKGIWHTLGVTQRSLQTTADDSMVLIQGRKVLYRDPIAFAKGTAKGLYAGFRKDPIAASERAMVQLQNHPKFAQAVQAGVEFSDPHGSFVKQEELFAGKIEEKVPILSHSKALSTVTMNEMRMGMFERMSKWAPGDAEYLKDVADQVNILTGKGAGPLVKSLGGEAWGNVFYAPRFYASNWQDHLLYPIWKARTAKGEMQAVRTYTQRAMLLVGSVYMAQRIGWDVDTDVRSTSFGRVTVPGGRSFDLFGKMAEPIRVLGKLLYGSVSNQGNYTGPGDYGAYTPADYAESKSSPVMRTAAMLTSGKTWDEKTGERRQVEGLDFLKQYEPLSMKEILPMIESGDPNLIPFIILSFFGGDVRPPRLKGAPAKPAPPLDFLRPPGMFGKPKK